MVAWAVLDLELNIITLNTLIQAFVVKIFFRYYHINTLTWMTKYFLLTFLRTKNKIPSKIGIDRPR